MFPVASEWNPKQARLKERILHPEAFEEAMRLCLALHAVVHCAEVSHSPAPTFQDAVWEGLTREAFVVMPTVKDVTVAWNLWHITRIED